MQNSHSPLSPLQQKTNIPNSLSKRMLSLSSPSSLQGDTMKVWQCSLAVGGKPQKRAGGRGDQSSDTAATSTKPDRCFEEVLPQVFYQKNGCRQRPLAYASQSLTQAVSKNISAFTDCRQMLSLCIC